MSEKQREEFDVFWQEKILDAGWTLNKTESYFVWKRAWQAALSSVVVEIPKTGLGFEDVFYMRGDQVVSALEKAGIRYE